MGRILAAFLAGKNPANEPAKMSKSVAYTATFISTPGFLKKGVPSGRRVLTNSNKPIPHSRPIYPEMAVINMDS